MVKNRFLTTFIGLILLWGFGFESCLIAQEKPLRIYGPEGPFAAISECAEMFSRIYGIKTELLTGPGTHWIIRAKENADVVYEETEHGLTQFMTRYP